MKLRGILLIGSIFILKTISWSQNDTIYPMTQFVKDFDDYNQNSEQKKKVYSKYDIWNISSEMLDYTTMVSEPSTLSSFANWKKQVNGYQKKNYVIHWNNRTPYGTGRKFRLGRLALNLELLPSVNVRIFQNQTTSEFGDSSLPVRTPSYIPGADLFVSSPRLWKMNDSLKKRAFYFHWRGYHHSDGQDGAYFDSLGFVNRYNGDFGEQIVFQYGVGMIKKREPFFAGFLKKSKWLFRNVRSNDMSGTTYLQVDWENSPINLFPIPNTSRGWLPYHIYNRNRILIKFGQIWHPERRTLLHYKTDKLDRHYLLHDYRIREVLRYHINIDYAIDSKYQVGSIYNLEAVPMLDIKRLNIDFTLFWPIPNNEVVGLFAKAAWVGNDRYNVYFQDRYLEARIGIAYGWFAKK